MTTRLVKEKTSGFLLLSRVLPNLDAKARLNIRRNPTSLSSFALLGYEDGGNLEWGLWFPDDTSFMETH